MMKWFGIGFLYLLPFLYIGLMKSTQQPIEWFVVVFIFLMAVAITLYATVFKRSLEDTEENREMLGKIVKKTIGKGMGGLDE